MSGKRFAIVAIVLSTTIAVGFSVQTALRAEDAVATPHGAASAPPAQKKNATEKDAESRLRSLPCFGCHNFEHFRLGKPKPLAAAATASDDDVAETAEFSHTFHQKEGVGHCHMCHAFEGHFQVTIRKETCAGCH
jgi:hypothetical protein